MANPTITLEQAKEMIDCLNQCIKEGFKFRGAPSAVVEAGKRLGLARSAAWSRVYSAKDNYHLEPSTPEIVYSPEQDMVEAPQVNMTNLIRLELLKSPRSLAELISKTHSDTAQVLDAVDELIKQGVRVHRIGDRYDIPKTMPAAYLSQHIVEIHSDKGNRYKLGCVSDNHCASKYERRDVLANLYDRFEEAGVTQVLHAGNWIDGNARFNTHDLLAHGLECQCQMLAETYPQRPGITTYAVWGDDHEGWYAQREGIDVGAYCEAIFRKHEREDWVNVGFMEANIPLVNSNSGKKALLALVHPGGGSSYALSYAIQKIIESLEGGEKPAVGIYGHLHKMWAGNIRNVWCLITGCCQDQTPFMRKNKLEAHIGGTIVTMEQDPETGAITSFCPDMKRYFTRGYYADARWSHHGPVNKPDRSVGGV